MIDDSHLRERIREAIKAGELPDRSPDQVLGGAATGSRCALCGQSIQGGSEMELVFEENGQPGRRSYAAHPHCFWMFGRELGTVHGESAPTKEADVGD